MLNVLDKSSPLQVLLNVVLFFSLALILHHYCINNKRVSNPLKVIIVGSIVIFCLFPFWGNDYWHYMSDFSHIKHGDLTTNLEEIYDIIIKEYMPSYFVFRLVIWGLSVYLLYRLFGNEKIRFEVGTFIFVISFLPLFSYARAILPMTMMYLGVSILYDKKVRFISRYLVGISLVLCSIPFHKSALFGVLIIAVSIIVTNKSKYLYLLLILATPFLLNYLENNVDVLLDYMGSSENIALQVGQQYMESESKQMGLAMKIYNVLQKIPFVVIIILYVQLQKNKSFEKMPKSIQAFSNIALLELFVSFLLLFVNINLNFSVISYRFSYFAWIPAIIVLSYCKTQGLCPRTINICLIAAFISSSYSLVYAWYNAL